MNLVSKKTLSTNLPKIMRNPPKGKKFPFSGISLRFSMVIVEVLWFSDLELSTVKLKKFLS